MKKENKEELNDFEKLMIFLMKRRREGINHWGQLRKLAKEKFGSSDFWSKKFEWTTLLRMVCLSQPKKFEEYALELQIDDLREKGKSFKEIAKKLKLPKRKVLWLWEKWDKKPMKITLKQRAEFYGTSVSTIKRILKEKPKPKPVTRKELGYYIGDILYQIDSVWEE